MPRPPRVRLIFTGPAAQSFERRAIPALEARAGRYARGRPPTRQADAARAVSEWRPMSLSPADMDFTAARHGAARDIALAFGVPPMLLGIPGDNTYSNYREANLAFWRQTALPLAQKAARAIEAWIGDRWPPAPGGS